MAQINNVINYHLTLISTEYNLWSAHNVLQKLEDEKKGIRLFNKSVSCSGNKFDSGKFKTNDKITKMHMCEAKAKAKANKNHKTQPICISNYILTSYAIFILSHNQWLFLIGLPVALFNIKRFDSCLVPHWMLWTTLLQYVGILFLMTACWQRANERENVCIFIQFVRSVNCGYLLLYQKLTHQLFCTHFISTLARYEPVHVECAHSCNVCVSVNVTMHAHKQTHTKEGETDALSFEYAFYSVNVCVLCTQVVNWSACDLCCFSYGSSVKLCMCASLCFLLEKTSIGKPEWVAKDIQFPCNFEIHRNKALSCL